MFGSVLVLAILISLPGQRRVVFGVELMALAVLTGIGLYLLDRRAGHPPTRQRIARALDVVSPNTVTSALFFAAGLILALGLDAGMYVMVAAVLGVFIGGVASAWLFLTRVRE